MKLLTSPHIKIYPMREHCLMLDLTEVNDFTKHKSNVRII